MINDHLRAALKYCDGLMDEATLSRAIERGDYHVIKLPKSTILVEFKDHEGGFRTIEFPFAGGDLDEIRSFEPSLLRWGREEGCKKAILHGRRGWSRALGYRPVITVMSKDL
jgi:hypothetical protein